MRSKCIIAAHVALGVGAAGCSRSAGDDPNGVSENAQAETSPVTDKQFSPPQSACTKADLKKGIGEGQESLQGFVDLCRNYNEVVDREKGNGDRPISSPKFDGARLYGLSQDSNFGQFSRFDGYCFVSYVQADLFGRPNGTDLGEPINVTGSGFTMQYKIAQPGLDRYIPITLVAHFNGSTSLPHRRFVLPVGVARGYDVLMNEFDEKVKLPVFDLIGVVGFNGIERDGKGYSWRDVVVEYDEARACELLNKAKENDCFDCSDALRGAPRANPGNVSGMTSGSGNAAPKVQALDEYAVQGAVDTWLAAQNNGSFADYEKLYAAQMTGIKRVGARTFRFDRLGWLKDRERMFKHTMVVSAAEPAIEVGSTTATVHFVQSFSQGRFKDVGFKELTFVRDGSGLKISREEMLESHAVSTPNE